MNNTITIILDASGSVANVRKDFSLYQGQYQSKLLDILVPTSILAPKLYMQYYIGQMALASTPTDTQLNLFVEENTEPSRQPQDGDVVEVYNSTDQTYWLYVYVNGEWTSSEVDSFGTENLLEGTAVKVGLRATQRNGIIYESEPYYVKFLKQVTINGYDYALYERELPYVFTKFAGQGQNAPQLVCNVVNVDLKNDSVISMITTQTCGLDVMPSSSFDADVDVEYDVIDEIEADINTLAGNLELKQDKEDNALQTTSKNIVGAINEVNSNEQVDRDNITDNSQNIADLDGRVTAMEEQIGTGGYTFIGTLKLDTMPSQEQLTDFVILTAGREPKGNDVISFVLLVSGGTDKNYKYTYSGATDEWSGYEIPATEPASNTDKGIVQGSYDTTQAQSRKTQVNIVGGEIKGIYLTDNNGTQQELANYVNNNASDIAKIKDGTTTVGLATRAEQDGSGANIELTYMTKFAGATKTFVENYALPRAFNDVSFLEADNVMGDIIPDTQNALYTATYTGNILNGVELFYADKIVSGAYQLANKNSYSQTLYISSSVNIEAQIRTTIEIYNGGAWTTANVEITEPLNFVANTIKKVALGSTFNYLDSVLDIVDGNKIRTTVEALPTESTNTTFSVWSNQTYPSTFYLNTTSQTIEIATGYLGEIPELNATGAWSFIGMTQYLNFTFPQGTIIQENTLCDITLTCDTSLITSGLPVILTNGLTQIQIVNTSNFGTQTNLDVSELDNLNKTTSGSNTIFKFVGFMQDNRCYIVGGGASGGGIKEIVTDEIYWSTFFTNTPDGIYILSAPTNTDEITIHWGINDLDTETFPWNNPNQKMLMFVNGNYPTSPNITNFYWDGLTIITGGGANSIYDIRQRRDNPSIHTFNALTNVPATISNLIQTRFEAIYGELDLSTFLDWFSPQNLQNNKYTFMPDYMQSFEIKNDTTTLATLTYQEASTVLMTVVYHEENSHDVCDFTIRYGDKLLFYSFDYTDVVLLDTYTVDFANINGGGGSASIDGQFSIATTRPCANLKKPCILSKCLSTYVDDGRDVWTDGENIYYNNGTSDSKQFDKATQSWVNKTWNISNFNGRNVWHAWGRTFLCEYIALSMTQRNYVLENGEWIPFTFNNLNSAVIYGASIWQNYDGGMIFSYNSIQYLLLEGVSDYEINAIATTFSGLSAFDGENIWSDGEFIYLSNSSTQYKLDPTQTNTWVAQTWTGLQPNAIDIWSDGTTIYSSSSLGQDHYELDTSTDTWTQTTFMIYPYFEGRDVWTDGENIYAKGYKLLLKATKTQL